MGAAMEESGESNKIVAHTQIPTLTMNVFLRLILDLLFSAIESPI
jgi:hypothetical protein